MEKISYNIKEAAEVIGISRNLMYSQVLVQPDFPQVRIGSRILIPKAALEEWLLNRAAHVSEVNHDTFC